CICDDDDIDSFFFSSRRRHTRSKRDWSSDVCSSDLYIWLHLKGAKRQYVKENSSEQDQLNSLVNELIDAYDPNIAYLLKQDDERSEERRVGKECRYEVGESQYKKK